MQKPHHLGSRVDQEREVHGAHNSLMEELRLTGLGGYSNFVRMDPESFDHLFNLVEPFIRRTDTRFRRASTTRDFLTYPDWLLEILFRKLLSRERTFLSSETRFGNKGSETS